MEVNFFGVVAVTEAAMPHLRASGGRVFTVSSVRGAVGQPFNEAYCAAKFAVEGFLESLAPVAAPVAATVGVSHLSSIWDLATRWVAIMPFIRLYFHDSLLGPRPVMMESGWSELRRIA